MPKLQVNPDGTISFPLRPLEPGGEPRILNLDEPSMAQMAQMTERARQADEEVTQLDPIDLRDGSPPPTAEALGKYTEQINARTVEMFGEENPYGRAMIEVIKMLTGQEVTADDLYAWAMSPRALRKITEHFRAPLPGEE